MKDLTLVIPLINLIETDNQNDIFWSYNNYAKQFQRNGFLPKEEGKIYYSRYFDSNGHDKTLHKFYVKQYNFLDFKTLAEESILYDLFEDSEDTINDRTGFKIGLFSAKFQIDILKNNSDLGNYIEGVIGYFDRIEKINFEEENFCPDPKELDIVAKYFLGIIEPENLFDFLNFHLLEYEGDCCDFLKHSIELTSEIWNNSTPKNLERKIKFKDWVNYVVDRFELDKIKLGLTSTNSEQTDLMKNGNPTTSATVEKGVNLTYRQIATLYYLNGLGLTYDNADSIAFNHGQTSRTRGQQLMEKYYTPILKEVESLSNNKYNREIYANKKSFEAITKIIPLLKTEESKLIANEYLKKSESYRNVRP